MDNSIEGPEGPEMTVHKGISRSKLSMREEALGTGLFADHGRDLNVRVTKWINQYGEVGFVEIVPITERGKKYWRQLGYGESLYCFDLHADLDRILCKVPLLTEHRLP